MTFGQMLLEMVEGRHVGASRRPLGAAAATGLVLVAAQAARTVGRRQRGWLDPRRPGVPEYQLRTVPFYR